MEVPPWDGASSVLEYPAASKRPGPKGRKSKRKHDLRRKKELESLVSKTVGVPSSITRHSQDASKLAGHSRAALDESNSQTILQGTRSPNEEFAPDELAAQQHRSRQSQPVQHEAEQHGNAHTSSTLTKRKRATAKQAPSQPDHFATKRVGGKPSPLEQAQQLEGQGGPAAVELSLPESKTRRKKPSVAKLPGSALPQETADVTTATRLAAALQHAHSTAEPVPSRYVQYGKGSKQRGIGPTSQTATPAPAGKDGKKRGPDLLSKMRSQLQGGRFRWLNEQLYTQPGEQAFKLMHSDPDMFQEYHQGFQEQVRNWPQQPLQAAVRWVRRLPASASVADFGCGTAQLAAQVTQQVHSLDLVAAAPGVVACDMAHTPLETASLDAAVFCLALMGTDYGAFIAEAARVLKVQGQVWIAEVRSRFALPDGREDHESFRTALQQAGFKIVSKDASNKMFVVFVARKHSNVTDMDAVSWPVLKPCQYKRR